MTHTFRAAALLLGIAFHSPVTADETLFEPFDEEFQLDWKIVRETPKAYSLETNPGELTLTTQYGSIHGTTDPGDLACNLMLVDKELAPGSDFEATLAVSGFEPEIYYQQVALLVYQGDDDYVKWSMERSWQADGVDNLVMVLERAAETQHSFVTQKKIDGPFWLRLKRQATRYTVSFSNDGDEFEEIGTEAWTPSSAEQPVRVGFLAKNGGNPNASELDVTLEEFTLTLQP